MLYITKKLNKGGGVRHSTRTNWRKYSWENWWIEIAWGKDEEKTHRRHCLHKAIILYTPKKEQHISITICKQILACFYGIGINSKGTRLFTTAQYSSHIKNPQTGDSRSVIHSFWTIHPPQSVLAGGGGCSRGGRWAAVTTALCLPSSLTTVIQAGKDPWAQPLTGHHLEVFVTKGHSAPQGDGSRLYLSDPTQILSHHGNHNIPPSWYFRSL